MSYDTYCLYWGNDDKCRVMVLVRFKFRVMDKFMVRVIFLDAVMVRVRIKAPFNVMVIVQVRVKVME